MGNPKNFRIILFLSLLFSLIHQNSLFAGNQVRGDRVPLSLFGQESQFHCDILPPFLGQGMNLSPAAKGSSPLGASADLFPWSRYGEQTGHSWEGKINKEFFINFSDDFAEVFISPKNWKGKDFLNLSAVLGVGFLLYSADSDIYLWAGDHRNSSSDDIFKAVTLLGDGRVLLGLMTALYASGEVSHSSSLRKTALLSLESFLTTGAIVTGLKFISGRARPGTGNSSCTFHPFSTRSSFVSFPSGHASSAFAVAAVIAEQSRKAWIDITAFSLASLVAVSRVYNSKHWASDVFVGSSIGYFVAKKISALNRNRETGRVQVGLQFTRQRQALSFMVSF